LTPTAAIPFQGTPTAEEARTIARYLQKANPTGSLLPLVLWLGVISLIFGVWSFNLTTLNGFGWLATGLTFLVAYFVLRSSGGRSVARALQAASIAGSISDERIRLESPHETVELPIADSLLIGRTDHALVARVAGGQHLFWICRSTFASARAWDDACALLVRG
jgi:hypothetical protein